MKKIQREDWFKEGIFILERDGFSKITIENLCSILKVTKGSFYHHFGNMDGYIKALMDFWVQVNTDDFIHESEKVGDVSERQRFLYLKSINAEYQSEQFIRAWSYSNAIVKESVNKVDTIRLNYLIELKTKLGLDIEVARRTAMLDMAILVGMQQLYPDLVKDELVKIYSDKLGVFK